MTDEDNDIIQVTVTFQDRSFKTSAAFFLSHFVTKAISSDQLHIELNRSMIIKKLDIPKEDEEKIDVLDEAIDDAGWQGDLCSLMSHGLNYSARLSVGSLMELVACLKLYSKLGQKLLDVQARDDLDEDIEEWKEDWYAYPKQFKSEKNESEDNEPEEQAATEHIINQLLEISSKDKQGVKS